MSNRFDTLFALDKNLYAEGSPVIVSAGVLLKDTESNRLAIQLKFRNVTPKTIWALTVALTCVDTAGHPLGEPISYQYMDLTVSRGGEFGSKKAILVPDSKTRGFHITEINAVYSDGSSEAVPVQLSPLPAKEPLIAALGDAQLVKQYRLATNDKAEYVPCSDRGLQLCPCGQWHSQPFCAECGLGFAQATEAYDLPVLTETKDNRLEQEAADLEEQRRDNAYTKAVADLSSGKLQKLRKAEEALTALGDYRDCPALVQQCRDGIKSIALEKMQHPKSPYDYAEAEKIFRSLGDVDDCKALAEKCHAKYTTSKDHQADKLKKIAKRVIIAAILIALVVVGVPLTKTHIIPAVKYTQAEKLIDSAQYDEAAAAFEALGDYKDAHVRILDAQYRKAEALKTEGKYAEAAKLFDSLDDYLYARDKQTECIYLQAKDLMAEGSYESALRKLNTIGKYEDAPALVDECYIKLAEAEHAARRYKEALNYYGQVSRLNTEDATYIDSVYRVGLVSLTIGDYKQAAEMLGQAGEYEQAPAKRLEAMFNYVQATAGSPDDTTVTYLAALTEAGYEGTDQLQAAVEAAQKAAQEAEEAGVAPAEN